MNFLRILTLWIVCHFTSGIIVKNENNFTYSLDKLLNKRVYDSRLRPNFGGEPTTVKIGFWVLSIDRINVVDMDFMIDVFFRQEWQDSRLDLKLSEFMTISNSIKSNIWLPDTYFVNAKSGKFHRVTKDNSFFMLGPNGTIRYNSRITIQASCPMDLRKFPMDTQKCPLILESYGYSNKDILYKWEIKGNNGMMFVPKSLRMLPQFELSKVNLYSETNSYVAGEWSTLKTVFTLDRTSSHFLIQIYSPCALIVIMSWMSFVLPHNQYPARIALGVTALLTIVTVLNMLNTSMPKVNYIKVIDQYLIVCLMFIFSVLFEYAIVLYLLKKVKPKKELPTRPYDKNSKHLQEENAVLVMETIASNGICGSETKISNASKHLTGPCCTRKWTVTEATIDSLDDCCRICFPVAFAAFNIIYWTIVAVRD